MPDTPSAKPRLSVVGLSVVRGEPARPVAPGVVHIVGAGPGDPDLLTVKALKLLQAAEVVIHDRLVAQPILDLIRPEAVKLYVGKTRGDHSVPQDQIEQLMIDQARLGRMVVRLKGGDPFVFGRGGEELQSMLNAGLEAHVVPGVTAALACAASVGLPMTHRDHAQAVTLVTAQPKPGGEEADWSVLGAANHTVAVYMGAGLADRVALRLLDAGRAGSTPVAVVENGTRPDQRVLTGRLDGLGALVRSARITGPAMLFIGEVAAFAKDTVHEQEVAA